MLNHTPVTIDVRFELRIDGCGLILTLYTLESCPITPPATRVTPWNDTNAGGFEEVGVAYVLTSDVDAIAWSRKSLWSVYPTDHIGRVAGTAQRTGQGTAAQPGIKPNWSWAEAERDFALFCANDAGGRGSNDFRSMKEYIHFASAVAGNSKVQLRAESDGTDAARLEAVDPGRPKSEVRFIINNQWNYRQLGLGNYMKPPVIVQTGYTNAVRIRLVSE
jgi:hypothetical protein